MNISYNPVYTKQIEQYYIIGSKMISKYCYQSWESEEYCRDRLVRTLSKIDYSLPHTTITSYLKQSIYWNNKACGNKRKRHYKMIKKYPKRLFDRDRVLEDIIIQDSIKEVLKDSSIRSRKIIALYLGGSDYKKLVELTGLNSPVVRYIINRFRKEVEKLIY